MAKNKRGQEALGLLTLGLVQFGRIEVRQPNFDPLGRVGRTADAEAVAIADISDLADEALTGVGGQSSVAWVSQGGDGYADSSDDG